LKKNLLLLHLESLNLLNYKMNRDLFPTVSELEKKCKTFENYYSTATSTLMVVGDLLYGGMNLYEGCDSLAAIPKEYCYISSLFDDLKEQGYHAGIYIYPEGGDRESAEKRHIAGFKNQMELIRKYSEYVDSFDIIMDHQPFALMACNYISNLSFSRFLDIGNYGMETDYWEAGYRCMDRCCKDLLNLLKDKNLLENTVIVLYGDHGDDYWGHGMHNGLTHAIEPNNLLIHTPLIIWDGICRKEPEHEQRLVQTSDLREMIMTLVNGKSIEHLPNRQYAVSRNAYAAQPIRAESFNKAYSVTDGRYLLMVSSRGLEMYDTKMDPACQNNILRFFAYENGILKSNKKNQEFFQFHFYYFWSKREQRILRQKFYELRDVLYDKVLELYMAGDRSEKDMLDEMKFGKIDIAFDKETGQ
jgi:Arylsulfatase A and related enzymes